MRISAVTTITSVLAVAAITDAAAVLQRRRTDYGPYSLVFFTKEKMSIQKIPDEAWFRQKSGQWTRVYPMSDGFTFMDAKGYAYYTDEGEDDGGVPEKKYLALGKELPLTHMQPMVFQTSTENAIQFRLPADERPLASQSSWKINPSDGSELSLYRCEGHDDSETGIYNIVGDNIAESRTVGLNNCFEIELHFAKF